VKDLLDDLDRWKREQVRVALVRVVELDGTGSGSAPVGSGAAMAVNERGETVGSVSGAGVDPAVDPAVVAEALRVLQIGRPRLVTFGYRDDQAYSVGLSCGGRIHVLLEPLDW
jgi:xanthine/CO dehydrogenase XdhC/CoxF family maturation factor